MYFNKVYGFTILLSYSQNKQYVESVALSGQHLRVIVAHCCLNTLLVFYWESTQAAAISH